MLYISQFLKNRLKELRIEKGINQVELAKIFSVTKQTVSNWENGNRTPDIDTVNKLCEYFDVSTDYLMGNTEVKNFNFIQPLGRINRINYSNNEYNSKDSEIFNKDDLIKIIQNMIVRLEDKDALKDLFLFVYMYLDKHNYLDKEKDKYLIHLRNMLIHMIPTDSEIQELINMYKHNK